MPKKNGFEPPFAPLQVVSWVAFPVLTTAFYGLTIPPLGHAHVSVQIVFTVVHTVLMAMSLHLGVVMTKFDPTDPNVSKEDRDIDRESDEIAYCYLCEGYVHITSRHCRRCDKCVHGFDHHCQWLNNCVGSSNYHMFFRLVSLVLGLVTTQMLSVFVLLLEHHVLANSPEGLGVISSSPSWLQMWHDSTGKGGSYLVPLILLWFYLVVESVLVGMTGELWVFHIKLQRHRTTTYDFLTDVLRRERAAAKAKREREKAKADPNYRSESSDNSMAAVVPQPESDAKESSGRPKPILLPRTLTSIFFCRPDKNLIDYEVQMKLWESEKEGKEEEEEEEEESTDKNPPNASSEVGKANIEVRKSDVDLDINDDAGSRRNSLVETVV